MSGPTRLIASLLLTGITAGVAFAQPKQNLTLPYPAKVPIVLQLNGPERIRERLTKMIGALPPAEAKLITNQLEAGWKTAFTGRKLTAVPKDGRVFVVIHELARFGDDTPPVSVLIPVTSYQEFRATFLTDTSWALLSFGFGLVSRSNTASSSSLRPSRAARRSSSSIVATRALSASKNASTPSVPRLYSSTSFSSFSTR